MREMYRYRVLDTSEYDDTVAILRERLAEIENSHRMADHQEVFEKLFAKYGIERKGK